MWLPYRKIIFEAESIKSIISGKHDLPLVVTNLVNDVISGNSVNCTLDRINCTRSEFWLFIFLSIHLIIIALANFHSRMQLREPEVIIRGTHMERDY